MNRIFSKKTLRDYWVKYPEAKPYLQTWYDSVKKAEWKNPNEIRNFYATVSILKNSRVVFNIMGNKHRLIVKINYTKQWMFIRFIGTYQEYDKIDANDI